jgi:hypothetical protein
MSQNFSNFLAENIFKNHNIYPWSHSLVEQLNRIESDMETMNAEMKEAEKHITGMEKWCGICVCPWNRSVVARGTKLVFNFAPRGEM